MSSTTPGPLPPEVGQLGTFEARMTRSFRMAMEDWDEVCSALGAWEGKHLAREESKAAFEQHQTWVIQLLAWGKLLQQVTEYSGFCDRAAANRVTARLRHLEDKLALWHREILARLSSTSRTEFLRALRGRYCAWLKANEHPPRLPPKA